MHTVFTILFLTGVLMIAAGFMARIGTGTMSEIDANVASAFALLIVYAFMIVSLSSFSDLVPIFEGICGGIPFLDSIADYGSLRNVISAVPASAAASFLDVVILSATINILSLLPLTQGSAAGKFMVRLFTGIVLSMISLMLLNFVIKESAVYQGIVSLLGAAISLVSLGTVPFTLRALLAREQAVPTGFAGAFFLFSRSRIAGIIRDSFFKAVIYVLGIWLLEREFGSIAAAASWISILFVSFGPVFVMLIGIVLLLKTVLH